MILKIFYKFVRYHNKKEEKMKTIQINISEKDYQKYNFENNSLDFNDLIKKLDLVNAKNTLKESIKLAKSAGLSNLSEEEINYEIMQVRNAKNNN